MQPLRKCLSTYTYEIERIPKTCPESQFILRGLGAVVRAAVVFLL